MKTLVKNFFGEAFSLHSDKASLDEIYERLVVGAEIKGTNMCVLILAILIASIGLNMDSTAVIIGAMLISPLMGSIMAVSYGIVTGDSRIVRQFLFGFLLQVIISLLTSTLYFSITPISSSTSELLARTTPTIWDVLIAICGGLAGCIGLTRKEKSNVIPGVAIATALMPPLCTAGYGIATKQLDYFLGAFYLFTLNAYFICLSSVVVLLIIKIPKTSESASQNGKKLRIRVIVFTLILLIPSIFFAARMVRENDITGFEDEEIVQVQEIGDEAAILFPQVESISIKSGYEYQDSKAMYVESIEVILSEAMPESDLEKLKEWLQKKYPEINDIDIVYSNSFHDS